MARNGWFENLRCPQCGKLGIAELSMADGKGVLQLNPQPEPPGRR